MKWINKMKCVCMLYIHIYIYIYILEYYSEMGRNKLLTYAVTWMKFKDIILNETEQTEKATY